MINASYGLKTADTHTVLRNTYWLLALTMLPTILGAFLAVKFSIVAITSWAGALLVLLGLFGFIFAIQALKDSAWGIPVLLVFTFLMGLLMGPQLTHTLKFSNGGQLIMLAFAGTAAILVSLASYATVTKRDFSGYGKYLFISLIVLVLVGIANIWLQLPIISILFSAVAIIIFSFYIVYDVQQIVTGGETSYISATLGLYLDVLNIFQNLLSLLGVGFGDD